MNEFGRLLGRFQLWRYADLHAGTVVEVNLAKLEVQFLGVACVDMGIDDQLLVFLPLAGDRGDEGALERGPAVRLEAVHDR